MFSFRVTAKFNEKGVCDCGLPSVITLHSHVTGV